MIESVLHRRAAKLGSMRIEQELQDKGLDPEAISAALAALKATELARAQAVWQKKFGAPAANALEAARQMRFLATRGFGADVIRRAVKGPASD